MLYPNIKKDILMRLILCNGCLHGFVSVTLYPCIPLPCKSRFLLPPRGFQGVLHRCCNFRSFGCRASGQPDECGFRVRMMGILIGSALRETKMALTLDVNTVHLSCEAWQIHFGSVWQLSKWWKYNPMSSNKHNQIGENCLHRLQN